MTAERTVVEMGIASPDELDRVAQVVVETYVGGGYIDPASPYLRQLRNVEGRSRDSDLIVARLGDEVVGTVTFCRPGTPWSEISRPGEAEFRMLAVDTAFQGRGVGRALVQECLHRTAEAGAWATVISTVPSMKVAQRLYVRMGFVRTPQRDWAPRPGVDLLTYRREVPT